MLGQRQLALTDAYAATRTAVVLGSTVALAFVLVILSLAARQLINDQHRAENAALRLSGALDRAQSAEQAKTRFLANMSHEMRTPLNGVVGMTQALARTALDPMQRELLEAISFSSSTLDHLIGDLISVSRDGVAARTEREDQALPSGRRHPCHGLLPFAADAEAKDLAFTVEIEAGADVEVTGDSASLGELLACLLSNAIKFTERGQVSVGVRRSGETTFRVDVCDTGVGFDEATKSRMFETFSQNDDSETRRFGGAGLGLAVARRLAEELGGSLSAHSAPNLGSTFSFETEFPVVGDETPTEGDDDAGEVLRVLIVDDNATNRKVLELILEQLGADWVSVEDGQQAVEAARTQPFAAILMDIQMPVMDGLTATREIRRLEREAGRAAVPVIIVSANCQPEHLAAGCAAGAQRHLGKPISAQAPWSRR